jgi:hypothetical protein
LQFPELHKLEPLKLKGAAGIDFDNPKTSVGAGLKFIIEGNNVRNKEVLVMPFNDT